MRAGACGGAVRCRRCHAESATCRPLTLERWAASSVGFLCPDCYVRLEVVRAELRDAERRAYAAFIGERRLAESAAETALLKDLCLSYYMAYTHDEAIEAECYDLWLAGAARCGELRAEEVSTSD